MQTGLSFGKLLTTDYYTGQALFSEDIISWVIFFPGGRDSFLNSFQPLLIYIQNTIIISVVIFIVK